MINIRANLRFWIAHRMKYGKYRGYPVTKGYLRFMFDDSAEKYEKYLSKIQMKHLYIFIKQHFEIDEQALDTWSAPDSSFEERVLHNFTEKLRETPELLPDTPQMKMAFHNFLLDTMYSEQISLKSSQRNNLYNKIKLRLDT